MAIEPQEVEAIVLMAKTVGIIATSLYFGYHRHTVAKYVKKFGIQLPNLKRGRKTRELTSEELESKWVKQDECHHGFWTKRCSLCDKILASDAVDNIHKDTLQ